MDPDKNFVKYRAAFSPEAVRAIVKLSEFVDKISIEIERRGMMES